MLLQEAVEFVDRLGGFATEREISLALPRVFGLWGIEHYCFANFPRSDQRLDDIVLIKNVPQEWFDHYDQQNYLPSDAAIKFSKDTFYPFRYVDAPDPDNKAFKLIHEMTGFGLSNAMVFPVGSLNGKRGIVWVQGKKLDPTANAFLHTVILYTYERLLRVRNEPPSALLTCREVEVLKWSALGKSSWETGEILCIAQRTVEDHIASAIRKLNAGNRTHAVAIALRDHIIAL